MAPLWCPVLLTGTYGVSQATYRAHMLHVGCQERHFRTPAEHGVSAAERHSVHLCLHPLDPSTPTRGHTHLQTTNAHAYLVAHKETQAQTHEAIACLLKRNRCRC